MCCIGTSMNRGSGWKLVLTYYIYLNAYFNLLIYINKYNIKLRILKYGFFYNHLDTVSSLKR